jgi:hypothetical protein
MDITWWGFKEVSCPKCQAVSFLMEVHFSADGQLRFKYYCTTCKVCFPIDYFASQLKNIALGLDLEKNLASRNTVEKSIKSPIKPTVKQISSPKQTDEDRKFLRSLGIDPDGGNK